MSSGGKIRDAIKRSMADKNRVLGCGRTWSIDPPKGWEHEAEETLDTFSHPEGVGALQLSSMTKRSGDVTDDDLVEGIEDMRLAAEPRTKAAHGPFTGFMLRNEDNGQVGQYWFLRAGPLLVFVTYFCGKEHVGLESAAVSAALDTLRPA